MRNRLRYGLLAVTLIYGGLISNSAEAQYRVDKSGHIWLDGASDFNGMTSQLLEEIVGANFATFPHADVVYDALAEDDLGLCGDEARSRYHAKAGSEWCTEFTAFVYNEAEYDIGSATIVEQMAETFRQVGGWTEAGDLDAAQIEPGDYLALVGDGEPFNHSVIVVAISNDLRYVWTSEGNNGDCVKFEKRNLLVDNQLNSVFNGRGSITALANPPPEPQLDPGT